MSPARRVCAILPPIALCWAAAAVAVDVGSISLVESVPIETALGSADVPDAPAVWLEMIQGAQASIDVVAFYVSTDPDGEDPLRPILAALREAGGRGVRVRVLADLGFQRTYPEDLAALDAAGGVEVRLLDAKRLWGGVLHAKGMVVDGRELYLGSQNWDWRALEHIRELGVRVRHPALAGRMAAVFALDWDAAAAADGRAAAGESSRLDSPAAAPPHDEPTPAPGAPWTHAARLLTAGGDTVEAVFAASPPQALPAEVPWDLPLLIEAIDGARSELAVQLLSYGVADRDGYWDELDSALRRAAARGVRVRLLLANWAKRKSMLPWLLSLAAVPNLEVRFSNLPPWSGGFVPFARVEHAKLMVADRERGWIGTSNWSRDYFHESRNLGLLFRGRGLGEPLARWFETGWSGGHTEPVSPCGEYQPPRIGP